MNFKSRAQILADLLAETPAGGSKRIPASSIKDLRGSQHQATVALKSGISQQHLSRLESGQRELTPETAMKLGPALGVSGSELWLSEKVSALNRAAIKGEISPHLLLESILELAKSTPDSEVGDSLMDALLSVLKDALAKVDVEDVQALGTEEPDISMYSAKSMQGPRPDRDSSGRRIHKPNDPTGR